MYRQEHEFWAIGLRRTRLHIELAQISKMIPILKTWIYRAGLSLAPTILFQAQHWRMHRRFGSHTYWANLRDPKTFTEKLLRSKLDGEHAALACLVDKAEVKDWVAERIGKTHVIPTLGVFNTAEVVPLSELPRPCIIKPTHSSGHVIILRGFGFDPSPKEAKRRMHQWLRINHFCLTGEPQYKTILPRIICEPLLGDAGDDLPDYKIFCFRGSPMFIQVDLDRHTQHVRRYYDIDWNPQNFTMRYPLAEREIPRPANLEKMLEIARVLALDFAFVRVDLYSVNGDVYFGELTFHPESGTAPLSDYATDLALGGLLPGRGLVAS